MSKHFVPAKTRGVIRIMSIISALAIGAGGCEETVDITDATYRERMVVHAVLDPTDSVDITFTRTLPINQPYDAAQAELTDVEGTLTMVNPSGDIGFRAVLVHVGNGHYTATTEAGSGRAVVPREGYEYRLEATWRGKSVRARTTIPMSATIDSVMLVPSTWQYGGMPDSMFSVRAVIDPNPGEVYLLTAALYDPRTNEPRIEGNYAVAIARDRDTTSYGRIALFDEWTSFSGQEPVAAVIVAYDEQYYEFQRTYFRGDEQGPFGSGSDIVKWTVEGDGIGLFVGRSMTIVPVWR